MNSHSYAHLIYDKRNKCIQGEKTASSKMLLGKLDI
jgi:hypothetical protein